MKKGYTGKKACPDGEIYTFKNGIAVVPGFRLFHEPVLITLAQFKEMANGNKRSGSSEITQTSGNDLGK